VVEVPVAAAPFAAVPLAVIAGGEADLVARYEIPVARYEIPSVIRFYFI
jgi:hypothetical protein